MKILVYGAGVLGSYLAHMLIEGGNDVTMLARNERKTFLDREGLVIRHYMQLKTTIDKVRVIESLEGEDVYDIVFVVMQYYQLDAVLPAIAANHSKCIVFVGNNPDALKTLQRATQTSDKKVLFGFLSTGGRREKEKVISVHLRGHLSIGSANGDRSAYSLITEAFKETACRLTFHDAMDAWLKCHIAFIMPACYVCYILDGNLKKADRKLLYQIVDAAGEAYEAFKALGIPIIPESEADYYITKRKQCYRILWLMAKTKIGKLVASDHAMSAVGEMKALDAAFQALLSQYGKPMPNWDALRKASHIAER